MPIEASSVSDLTISGKRSRRGRRTIRPRGNTAKSASGMRWYESTFLASALSRESTRPRELQPVYGTFSSSR